MMRWPWWLLELADRAHLVELSEWPRLSPRRRWLVAANELLWRVLNRCARRSEGLWRYFDDGAAAALWRRDQAAGGEAARKWAG